MSSARLVLASQSPRRRELLQQIGVDFEPLAVDVPEQRDADETPAQYVRRVARDKARAGLARFAVGDKVRVLGADTEVVLNGEVFGKPVDDADAASMLERLAGRSHQVISWVWLLDHAREQEASCISRVTMMALSPQQIADYVASGEPRGKAGGYAIQGRAAAFVEHLEGSYSAVMGLPLFETAGLLRRCGLPEQACLSHSEPGMPAGRA